MTALEANVPGLGFCRVDIESGKISAVTRLDDEPASAPYLSPGFVDLQINGFAGVDFSSPELTVAELERVLPALWATGCTSFCPTLITNSIERLRRNFAVLEEARKQSSDFRSSTPCYHLEGPFLSSGPSHGAHEPAFMHAPDWNEFQVLQDAAGGNIGIVTIAPELPGAVDFVRRAVKSGIVVGISHTDGTRGDVHAAVEAGASLATHLGNGCPALLHRHDAPFWAQLASDRLTASIICDGFHVMPELVQVIHRVKGPDRCVLVTDAVHAAQMPPGNYRLGGREIELLATGQVVTANKQSMAGSTLSLDRAVTNLMQMASLPLAEALKAATQVPARMLARNSVCSELSAGMPANLVLFGIAGQHLNVAATILGGAVVHDRHGARSTARAFGPPSNVLR